MCSMDYAELRDWEDIIDTAVEWFGLKWHKGMMKAELRRLFPGVSLKTMSHVINHAKAKIRRLYGIDPLEYKGSQISFYESVLRGKDKTDTKIKAAERLDKLFNLEQVSGIDPEVTARKIREALAAMRKTVPDKPEEDEENNDGECIDEGECQNGNKATETPKEHTTGETQANSQYVQEDTDKDLGDPTEEMLQELKFNRDEPVSPASPESVEHLNTNFDNINGD